MLIPHFLRLFFLLRRFFIIKVFIIKVVKLSWVLFSILGTQQAFVNIQAATEIKFEVYSFILVEPNLGNVGVLKFTFKILFVQETFEIDFLSGGVLIM